MDQERWAELKAAERIWVTEHRAIEKSQELTKRMLAGGIGRVG